MHAAERVTDFINVRKGLMNPDGDQRQKAKSDQQEPGLMQFGDWSHTTKDFGFWLFTEAPQIPRQAFCVRQARKGEIHQSVSNNRHHIYENNCLTAAKTVPDQLL